MSGLCPPPLNPSTRNRQWYVDCARGRVGGWSDVVIDATTPARRSDGPGTRAPGSPRMARVARAPPGGPPCSTRGRRLPAATRDAQPIATARHEPAPGAVLPRTRDAEACGGGRLASSPGTAPPSAEASSRRRWSTSRRPPTTTPTATRKRPPIGRVDRAETLIPPWKAPHLRLCKADVVGSNPSGSTEVFRSRWVQLPPQLPPAHRRPPAIRVSRSTTAARFTDSAA